MSPDFGYQHHWLVWTIFVLGVAAAVLAGWPASPATSGWWQRPARVAAPALAGLLAGDATYRISVPFGLLNSLFLPDHTRIVVDAGRRRGYRATR